jgi:hypothetical protein
MAKKQTHESMGFPSAGNKGDNRPVVRRRPMGGGKPKVDKNGHLQPGDTSGK